MFVALVRLPPCNAHAPYCHMWPAPLYNIFPHYLTNEVILKSKLLNTKCVFWCSVQLRSDTFLILRRAEPDVTRNIYRSACTVLLLLSGFNEIWIFRTDVLTALSYQISGKSVGRGQQSCSAWAYGRTYMTKLTVDFGRRLKPNSATTMVILLQPLALLHTELLVFLH